MFLLHRCRPDHLGAFAPGWCRDLRANPLPRLLINGYVRTVRTARVYASCERYHTGIILYALSVALVESPYIDTREPHERPAFGRCQRARPTPRRTGPPYLYRCEDGKGFLTCALATAFQRTALQAGPQSRSRCHDGRHAGRASNRTGRVAGRRQSRRCTGLGRRSVTGAGRHGSALRSVFARLARAALLLIDAAIVSLAAGILVIASR